MSHMLNAQETCFIQLDSDLGVPDEGESRKTLGTYKIDKVLF